MSLPALVQSKGDSFANATTARTITLTTNVTAGSLLIVGVGTLGTTITLTVVDDLSNAFTQAGSYAANGNDRVSVWYLYNATSGSRTITVTPSATAFLAMGVLELSGMPSSGSPASTSTNTGAASTTPGCGSLTVTQNAIAIMTVSMASTRTLHGASKLGCAYYDNGGAFEPFAIAWGVVDATISPTLLLGGTANFASAGAVFNAASSGGGAASGVYFG